MKKPKPTCVLKMSCGLRYEIHQRKGTTLIRSNARDEDDPAELSAALDAVESVVLAHVAAGVDVTEAKYVAGLEEALQKILAVWE